MNNSPIEFLARQYDNVVKYDADGIPSIFVKFSKMKSSELDDALPDHTHPAFMMNNAEEEAILIGKYMASELESNGIKYSLPNMPPCLGMSHNTFLANMRAFGSGASGLTIADHGLITLLAHKNGWEPHGNNDFGCDWRDAVPWETGKAYNADDKRCFRGWLYQCIKAHTSAAEILPVSSPTHWKKIRQVGGTPADDTNYIASNNYQGTATLTGSGPISWYLGNDFANLCDIQGNAFEQVYGLRLVNCEIQILGDNNNAADPEADCSANGAWRAILPNQTDHGYTLVDPDSAGTLHYTWQNGKITIDTVEPEFDSEFRGTNFKDIAVNDSNVPYMPYIMYELGLAPIPGTNVQGYFNIQMTSEERVARRSGRYSNTSYSGVAALNFNNHRTSVQAFYGARLRARLNP